MRRRTWVSVAVGASATVAATALVSGFLGVPDDEATPGGWPGPSPAAAGELTAFDDCEELRQWYVAAALPHVTAWGLGGWWGPVPMGGRDDIVELDGQVRVAEDRSLHDAVGGSATGTNVQEAGVDEPDLAKTDGRVVAQVRGRDLLLTDVSGAEPRRLSSLRLPRDLQGAELLWVGDRLVVLGTTWQPWGGPWGGPVVLDRTARPGVIGPWPGDTTSSTRTLVVDVSDPTAPRVEHDGSIDGNLLSARQYGDTVRLVVATVTPAIDFVQPRRGRSQREARLENRRRVRESDIEDWLPNAEGDAAASPLVACQDVRHPDRSSGYGTVTVVGFDPADPGGRHATAVTTSSQIVYSSADRLYLAMSSQPDWWGKPERKPPATDVHAFALDGLDAGYVASGTVRGQVRDRWSLSEHDGYLRVATALGRDPWNPRENAVVVLTERGDRLVEVGAVARMGIEEQIRSVRWFDDLAVVVTFRQVDPLYTVDLSDPTRPRVVGELKIPGFSAYLHPLGDDLLLGLGQHASLRGELRGAQAAVFDLADLTRPRRVATRGFGTHGEFLAASDPRGLTYLPERRTVLAVLGDWDEGLTRLVVLRVGPDGALDEVSAEPVAGWDSASVRTLPLDDGRVAVVTAHDVELLTP